MPLAKGGSLQLIITVVIVQSPLLLLSNDYCYNCITQPIVICLEHVSVLCSALRFLYSALVNVRSALVNVRSTLRNIKLIRYKAKIDMAIVKTYI